MYVLASGILYFLVFSAAAKDRPAGAVPRLLLTDTLHPAGNPTRRRRPRFWGLPQVLCQTPPGEQTASSAWQVSTVSNVCVVHSIYHHHYDTRFKKTTSQVSLIPIMVALRKLAKRATTYPKYNTFNRASSISFIL